MRIWPFPTPRIIIIMLIKSVTWTVTVLLQHVMRNTLIFPINAQYNDNSHVMLPINAHPNRNNILHLSHVMFLINAHPNNNILHLSHVMSLINAHYNATHDVPYLGHEVCFRRDGQKGTGSKVKVQQDLAEWGPVLRLRLPRKQKRQNSITSHALHNTMQNNNSLWGTCMWSNT